jgi:hypothetical protein
MRMSQLVQRRDQHGIVVALSSSAWPGCVHVEWSDGRREWVQQDRLQTTVPTGYSRIRA